MTRPFRRKVLYIPGYDPFPPRRYRELYRREGREQAALSDYQLSMGPRIGKNGFGWGATSRFDERETVADFEVLVWSDIVQGSMGRGILATYGQLVRTAWVYIGSGALWRLMKLRRGPVIAALYPIVILLLQLAFAVLIATVVTRLAGFLLGSWAVLLGLAAFWGILILFNRIDRHLFAYYLMHDYAFTAAGNGAYPAALERRLAEFRTRVEQVLPEDWDEVLIVGHSSGAYLSVSVLADFLRDAETEVARKRLALLTLGHVVPMASFLPEAHRLRSDLALLGGQKMIFWLDVTAPGDACCFALCDPVSITGGTEAEQHGPIVISAAFTQTLSQERQADLRGRWFRKHFQYLCAFDRPGDYDYFAITTGPLALADRFANRAHSPGRISATVGPAS